MYKKYRICVFCNEHNTFICVFNIEHDFGCKGTKNILYMQINIEKSWIFFDKEKIRTCEARINVI